jgi:hypothetical protein
VITENTPWVRPWSTDRSSCDPAGDLWGWDCGADQLAAVEMMGDVVSRQLVETHVQVALGSTDGLTRISTSRVVATENWANEVCDDAVVTTTNRGSRRLRRKGGSDRAAHRGGRESCCVSDSPDDRASSDVRVLD